MPFVEASIYDPPQPGWRVLVMRRWPRGIRKNRVDVWYPDAAPSAKLLEAYQNGAFGFEELAGRYVAEVRHNAGVLEYLRQIEHDQGTVILLCWERSPRPCQGMSCSQC